MGENKEFIVIIIDKGYIINSVNEVVVEVIEKYENLVDFFVEVNFIIEKVKIEINGIYKVVDVKVLYDSVKDKLVIILRDKIEIVIFKIIYVGIGDEKVDLIVNLVDLIGINLDFFVEGFRVNKIDKLGVVGVKNIDDV